MKLSPIINYVGSKFNLSRHIIPYIPNSHIYVEPFAGTATILFNISPRPIEVINDINEELVNLFRVMQDRSAFEDLLHRLKFTLYSRAEFSKALSILKSSNSYNSIDKSWAFFVVNNQGFVSAGNINEITVGEWGRSIKENSRTVRWINKLDKLEYYHNRLKKVQIDCIDGIKCIKYWDTSNTFFYIDPPYVLSSRKDKNVYINELDDDYHKRLVEVLLQLKGSAILSGYDNEIYKPLTDAKWRRIEIKTYCMSSVIKKNTPPDKAKREPRIEVLWISPNIKPI